MIGRLLLANVLELVIGLGCATLLAAPLGTSYLLGLAVVGIVSAHLALVHVSFGWPLLIAGAGLAVVVLIRRRPRLSRPGPLDVAGVALLAVLLVHAWPAFRSRALVDYDSWAIWGMKARALALVGWADPALFASKVAAPAQLGYPLLVPSLEAIAARAMGGFDPRLVHLQFLLFAVAGIAALRSLLATRVRGIVLWPALLALAAAPAFSGQLVTADADVPLALFFAAGLVAAAEWIDDGRRTTLALATVFFAVAVLTKNEGVIFVAASYLGLLAATRRWRPLLLSACCVELVLLPWQLFLAIHHVHTDTLASFDALRVHHPGIAPLAFHSLLNRAIDPDEWPLLLPLFAAAALLAWRSRLALFAALWALASLLGLSWVYVVSKLEWSNYLSYSRDRVIDSVVVGAIALTPLLVAEATRIGRR